jgi:AraC-like DNA-binding protein
MVEFSQFQGRELFMSTQTESRLEGGAFVSMTEPTVPVALPALLVRLVQEKGGALAELLEGTGLRAEHFQHPDTRLNYLQVSTINARALALTADAGLGLTFGQSVRPAHMGGLGIALACAPTLGDVLTTTVQYQKLLGSAFDLRRVDMGSQVAIIASKLIPLNGIYHFNQETWLTAIVKIAERLAERELTELQVHFNYPPPTHADAYSAVFGNRVQFGQAYCQVVFPQSILAQPLPGASISSFMTARSHCDKALASKRVQQSLPDRVRQLVRADLGNPPKADAIADSLYLSPRSLHRRLSELDTSYRQLLNEEKSSAATAFLRESTLPISIIATRLGFDNASNFIKSFRGWTGTTPQQFRAT